MCSVAGDFLEYSNHAIQLLGAVLALEVDKPFGEFLEQELVALNLTETRLNYAFRLFANRCR